MHVVSCPQTLVTRQIAHSPTSQKSYTYLTSSNCCQLQRCAPHNVLILLACTLQPSLANSPSMVDNASRVTTMHVLLVCTAPDCMRLRTSGIALTERAKGDISSADSGQARSMSPVCSHKRKRTPDVEKKHHTAE